MYVVSCINENGQMYARNGLLQSYQKDSYNMPEFRELARARRFSQAFIRRYPQVIVQIYSDNELVESFQDEEYWNWKEKNNQEWHSTKKNMAKVSSYVTYALIIFTGIFLTIATHIMGAYGLTLVQKLIIAPILIAAFWWVVNYCMRIV